MIRIEQHWIPAEHKKIRPGLPLEPEYITVHETDNTDAGSDADAHARLLARGNTRTASWHYTVDDQKIVQHLPDNEVAWHAGDGHDGPGNRKSLAVEICVNQDGHFETAKRNAVWLIRHLMKKHRIPLERVVPHRHWSGKNCPRRILANWDGFVSQIEQTKLFNPAWDLNPEYHRELSWQIPMMRGEDIKRLQKRLEIEDDGFFGPITREAVLNWQKAHPGPYGVTGGVNREMWDALFAAKPVYRMTVDGEVKLDSAEEETLVSLVRMSIRRGVQEIRIQRM